MGWSREFLHSLTYETTRPPVWALDVLRTPSGGAERVFGSHQGIGGAVRIASTPAMGSAKVQPVAWTYASGTWSVALRGPDADIAVRGCPRGSIVSLMMGWVADPGALHPVALGIVRNITGGPGGYRVDCWDLVTGLKTRLTTDPDQMPLFWDVVQETTTAAGYTAGDPTLNITDASIMQHEDGEDGVVRITPDAGDDFYLTYTDIVGNQLQGLSATARFDTVAANAANGNAIANVGYIKGHPLDIARKILISGSGGGAYDTLPDNWGLGVPEGLFDHQDINAWRDGVIKPSSGSYDVEVVVESPVSDAWSWLSGILALFGIWPVSRQGEISFRAAQRASDPLLVDGSIIDLSDLEEGDSWGWECQASEIPVQYGGVTVSNSLASVTSNVVRVSQYPALENYAYDLSPYVWLNPAPINSDVSTRLQEWALYPPESFDLTLRGLRYAGLVPGDLVYLDLPNLRGRRTAQNQSYSGVRAFVAMVAPDWSRHINKIRIYPEQETD